jgi:prepilin-type processing-associated H-X9-DG protein
LCQKYRQSGFSYFMGSAGFYLLNDNSPASVIMHSIATPSSYVLSGDCNYASDPVNADLNNNNADTLFANLPPPFHNHRVNVLFADWHVKSYGNFKGSEMTFSYNTSTGIGIPW